MSGSSFAQRIGSRTRLIEAFKARVRDEFFTGKHWLMIDEVEVEGGRELVIFGMWKIVRKNNNNILNLYEKNWHMGNVVWNRLHPFEYPEIFKQIKFIGVGGATSTSLGINILKVVISKLAGKIAEEIGVSTNLSVNDNDVAALLYSLLLRRSGKTRFFVKTFNKAFFKHYVDKQFMSLLLSMDVRASLYLYFAWQPLKENLISISQINSNIIPLLRVFDPCSKPDRQIIQNPSLLRYDVLNKNDSFHSKFGFISKGTYDYIISLPSKVINAILVHICSYENIECILSRFKLLKSLNIPLPVIAITHLLKHSRLSYFHTRKYDLTIPFEKIYARHVYNVWKTEGFQAVRQFLASNDLETIIRYFTVLPIHVLSNITWERLMEMYEGVADEKEVIEEYSWDDIYVTTQIINNYKFTPLLCSDALNNEGDTMHNCIGSYANRCNKDLYRVYHVASAKNKDVATLGIYFNEGIPELDCFKGKYNKSLTNNKSLSNSVDIFFKQYKDDFSKAMEEAS